MYALRLKSWKNVFNFINFKNVGNPNIQKRLEICIDDFSAFSKWNMNDEKKRRKWIVKKNKNADML